MGNFSFWLSSLLSSCGKNASVSHSLIFSRIGACCGGATCWTTTGLNLYEYDSQGYFQHEIFWFHTCCSFFFKTQIKEMIRTPTTMGRIVVRTILRPYFLQLLKIHNLWLCNKVYRKYVTKSYREFLKAVPDSVGIWSDRLQISIWRQRPPCRYGINLPNFQRYLTDPYHPLVLSHE